MSWCRGDSNYELVKLFVRRRPRRSVLAALGETAGPQRDFWTPENPRFCKLGNLACETLDVDERYAVYQLRSDIEWIPYSFSFMELRPGALKFPDS